MTPRPLTPADAETYVAHRREMLLDAPWAFAASPGSDRAGDPATVREALARPENAIVAIFEGGWIVASAGVRREEHAKARHLAGIWGVYVTPAARGRGLGRAVVAAAIETARGWPGVAGIWLSVSENSPAARRVYESLGFVAWGVEPDALRVDGRSYAEVHLRLSL